MRRPNRWGYLDTNGNMAVNPIYYSAGQFYEGRAVVEVNVGPEIDHPVFGRVRQRILRKVIINRAGTTITKAPYEDIQSFSEGLAAVKVNRAWGYIDTSGTIVIAPRFSSASSFRGGRAIVDSTTVINKSGEPIAAPSSNEQLQRPATEPSRVSKMVARLQLALQTLRWIDCVMPILALLVACPTVVLWASRRREPTGQVRPALIGGLAVGAIAAGVYFMCGLPLADGVAWARVQRADTVSAYSDYCRDWPTRVHSSEAGRAMNESVDLRFATSVRLCTVRSLDTSPGIHPVRPGSWVDSMYSEDTDVSEFIVERAHIALDYSSVSGSVAELATKSFGKLTCSRTERAQGQDGGWVCRGTQGNAKLWNRFSRDSASVPDDRHNRMCDQLPPPVFGIPRRRNR